MELLTPSFLRRLHHLRDRLSSSLARFEFFRTSPTGNLVTPETESHRPYSPGDDPRYIDWSIYARQERYLIKTVVREAEGVVHLLVDTSRSMGDPYPGKYHRYLETAAAIGYLALVAGNQVVLSSFSEQILLTRSFEKGENSAHGFLQQMQTLPRGSETDLNRSLEQLRGLLKDSFSRILIFSDFIDRKPYWENLHVLAATGSRLAALRILDEREKRPRLKGPLRMIDTESGRHVLRLVGHQLMKEYREGIRTFFRETEESFVRNRIPFMGASSDSSFEEIVLDFFLMPSWSNWS